MVYHLTKPQQTIYYMEKISGDSVSVICGSMLMKASKSVSEMTAAIQEIYRLNDSLRIRIKEEKGQTLQYISEYQEQNIDVLYFNSKKELDSYSSEFAKVPFDLSGSLCDMRLIILPEQAGLLAKFHHLVGDAWTISLIGTQFQKILNHEAVEAFSYIDYIHAEENYLESNRYQKDKAYFIAQKESYDTPIYISDKETELLQARRKSFEIDTKTTAELLNYANQNNVSAFHLFMTVIAIYNSRIKMNVENFFIGTTTLNRNGAKEKNTMGMFVNTVPVSIQLKNNASFLQNLISVQDSSLGVLRHQKYNYGDLLQHIGASEKLFDVIFSYQNARIFGDKVETTWYHCGMQNESLQIHMDDRDRKGIFRMHYDYQTDKFTEKDIELLHNHICTLLSDAIKNPDKKICDLSLLTPVEKKKILYDFNSTTIEYPRDKCVHTLFEEQVQKTPDKTAVIACDRTLTYQELNEAANRIAHALMEQGIGKGDIVAFSLPRRSFLMPTLLGILKSGAAYLPIPPDYPAERIQYMLSDSGARLYITEDTLESLFQNSNTDNPVSTVSGKDLCYCIYTSGSTGKPKGTLITHGNIANYIACNKYNITHNIIKPEHRRILSLTTVGFDIFVTESLLPLTNGMEIVLASEEQTRLQTKLSQLLQAYPVDVIQTTPTKIKSLIADKSQVGFMKKVKAILLGGETLDLSLVTELRGITDGEIFNLYGPTETTVWVSNARILDNDIPIGKPMANTQIYILDKYMQPVPIGVTGELCIAGNCVGTGYLNNSPLTAEKFVTNPFGTGMLYKTGDLAYWREDGNIAYVGRNDFQVKLRGLRIELGEIENALLALDGIHLAVVVVRKDSQDRQLICAFYTGEEKSSPELRNALKEQLPKYMIPHIFTYLTEIPVTTSGKINRKALPEIDLEHIKTVVEYLAPETPKEQLLVTCVENILGYHHISMLDNFFDLGGDSLKAIELTSLLESEGYSVEIQDIFHGENLKELAAVLTETIVSASHSILSDNPAKISDSNSMLSDNPEYASYGSVLPATPAQLRVYTAQYMNPASTLYNIPYVFQVESFDKERLEYALNQLIARHESLRTHFEHRDGQIVQVIEESVRIMVTELEHEDISAFIKPFDLTHTPLVRAGYYKNTIMIDMHHIISDGTSLSVFYRELNELYMGRVLSSPAVQYGSFAVRNRDLGESENYWLSVFEDDIPTLELPTDYKRGEQQSFCGNALYDVIDMALHRSILDKCRQLGITPAVYYMGCFHIFLAKLSGSEDIVAGMPISGREGHFLDTVGMFVNTIALRNRPEGTKMVCEFLNEVRQHFIDGMHHQDYPFGELVKKLHLEAGGRNPLYDVLLAYQSEEMTDIIFADKKATLLPVPITTAKCDLSFYVMPRKDDVVLMAEYCTDLYREQTITRFVAFFKEILKHCLNEKQLIKDVAIMNEGEKQKVLYDFNDTKFDYPIPDSSTIYSLFEKTAKNNTSKICITVSGQSVTYGELLSLSRTMDCKINAVTQGKKSIIALITERSIEMYAAIFGIIRGGNAYLPISPDYPKERIDYILKDSAAVMVMAQDKFIKCISDIPCLNITDFVHTALSDIEAPLNTNTIPSNAQPEDTAYVIYTSGSTGNPKGVKINHKSAINRILWMQEAYPLKENSVILQKTPYTFDVSVWELFWWSMCGASLAASKPDEHFLPAKILDEVSNNQVTHLHFVPSVFDVFLTYLEHHKDEGYKFHSAKHVFLSGEALSAELISRFYALFCYENIKLHNLYGPTECAVDVTYYDCVPGDTNPVPIGKPIYNTQIYIVDKYMNPLPVGVKGELCIGGINVGQGYLNNSNLTAAKFIDNPLGIGKLYKTGDFAYLREDEQIIFCGRMDGQVKFNGQRIEIGEIESTIKRIADIDSAAVVIQKNQGQDILAAFYCSKNVSQQTVRKQCEKTLPRYMVPTAIIKMDEMPLNSSGKLDRKALLNKKIDLWEREVYEAPINEREKVICDLFSQLLDIKDIDRNSNFFDLGGTSLTMIAFLSEDKFKDISAPNFIANPTPARLARFMQEKQNSAFQFIKTLRDFPGCQKALVLIPYAGGGAESFASFVNTFTNLTQEYSIYYIDYLHTYGECASACEELNFLSASKDLYMYSHCSGSAVAMQLINILELKQKDIIKHYVSGGFIPPKKASKNNSWNSVPDHALKILLTKAGAPFEDFSREQIREMLTLFRRDTDFMTQYFAQDIPAIHCPVSAIISQKDIFTKNYKKAGQLWANYAANFQRIRFIDSASHYFQSDNCEEFARILLSLLERV